MMLRDAFDLPPDPVAPPAPEPVVRRLRRLGLEDAETVAILELLGFRREDGRRMGLPTVEVVGVNEILSAVETVLRAMSREAPLVMFVDDWQWADDLSRAASGSFGRALRDTPSLAMIAMRPTETTSMPDLGVETIELGPFRELESAQAIDALSPDGLDLGIARDLHERSGGNPLFLEELCRQRAQDSAGSAGSLSVPPTLSGLIERRVHSLPEPHAEVLRAAAVIGNLVPIWLLDEICEVDDLQPSLGALAAQDLLYPAPAEGTLRFKHGITRDTVYRSIKLVERRRLHTRAAAALTRRHGSSESELPLESLATHHEAAGDDENASLFAERAGDRAWKDASLDRARIQYLSALEALERLPDTPVHKRRWVDIANRCAVACVYAPTSERHLEMMGRAARLARELGDTQAEAIAHSWHGFLHYARGNVQESIACFDQGLGIAERSRDEGLSAQILANLGQSHAAACDYAAALPRLERALGVEGRRPAALPKPKGNLGKAYALACGALALFDQGDVETAESWMDAALEAVRGTGHPIEASCLAFASAKFALSGRFAECAQLARRVQAMGQQMNGPYLYARGQADGAYARFMEHGRAEDLTTLRDSVEWLDVKGIRLYHSIGLAYLCEAMMEAGRFDEAAHYAERALDRALEQDPLGEGTALRTLARLALRPGGGGSESAMRHLERAFSIAEERGSARERVLTEATRAEILADIGDQASARDLLGEALPRLAAMRLDGYAKRARALAQRLS
jgi:tetratricopeptide (TPR) repeat protein